MDIGIGLPSTIPGIPGRLIAEWAVAAERAGFSTLGTIDRVVYGNLEPLSVMAAAAAVTERIGLTTAVLIGPTVAMAHCWQSSCPPWTSEAGRSTASWPNCALSGRVSRGASARSAPRLADLTFFSFGLQVPGVRRGHVGDYGRPGSRRSPRRERAGRMGSKRVRSRVWQVTAGPGR